MAMQEGSFSIAAGSVADIPITGVGFEPTNIQMTYAPEVVGGTASGGSCRIGSQGPSTGAGNGVSVGVTAGAAQFDVGAISNVLAMGGAAGAQTLAGNVKSYDEDGFTLELTANTHNFDIRCLYQASNNS